MAISVLLCPHWDRLTNPGDRFAAAPYAGELLRRACCCAVPVAPRVPAAARTTAVSARAACARAAPARDPYESVGVATWFSSQPSMLRASVGIGSEPWSRTAAWKAGSENDAPSRWRARSRRRSISSLPVR